VPLSGNELNETATTCSCYLVGWWLLRLLEEISHVVVECDLFHLLKRQLLGLVVDLPLHISRDDAALLQPVTSGGEIHLLQLLVVDAVGLLEISHEVQVEVDLIPELLVLQLQPLLLVLQDEDAAVEVADGDRVDHHDAGREDGEEDDGDDDEGVHDLLSCATEWQRVEPNCYNM